MIRPGRNAARNARFAAGVFVFWLLAGCATLVPQSVELRKARPAGIPERVELTAVPFYPQLEYQCGPAALATELGAFGLKVTPEQLAPQVYLPARKGSLQVEMLAAARRHGLVSYVLSPTYEDLLREIASGTPVIVLEDTGLILRGWHYAVAVGYDYHGGWLVLRSGVQKRELSPFAAFELMWKKSGYWAMVAVPPDRIPVTADEQRWLAAVAALEGAGQPAAARTGYETFLKRWPDNVDASIGLANADYTLHDLPAAEQVLRRAAERSPDSVVVLNNLAQTLSDLGRNAEALRIIERAATLGGPFQDAVRGTREQIRKRLATGKR